MRVPPSARRSAAVEPTNNTVCALRGAEKGRKRKMRRVQYRRLSRLPVVNTAPLQLPSSAFMGEPFKSVTFYSIRVRCR